MNKIIYLFFLILITTSNIHGMFWPSSSLENICVSVFPGVNAVLPETTPRIIEQHLSKKQKQAPLTVPHSASANNESAQFNNSSTQNIVTSFFSLSQLENIPVETFSHILKARRKTISDKESNRPKYFPSEHKRNTK